MYAHRFRARSTFLWQKKPGGLFVSEVRAVAGVFYASQKIGGGSAAGASISLCQTCDMHALLSRILCIYPQLYRSQGKLWVQFSVVGCYCYYVVDFYECQDGAKFACIEPYVKHRQCSFRICFNSLTVALTFSRHQGGSMGGSEVSLTAIFSTPATPAARAYQHDGRTSGL